MHTKPKAFLRWLISWSRDTAPCAAGEQEFDGEELRGPLNYTADFTQRDALLAQRYLASALRTPTGRLDAIHLWIWLIRLDKSGQIWHEDEQALITVFDISADTIQALSRGMALVLSKHGQLDILNPWKAFADLGVDTTGRHSEQIDNVIPFPQDRCRKRA